MQELISHYLDQLANSIAAPLYFHFGHLSYVCDALSLMFDAVDIVATYYLFFFFLVALIFFRNYIFSFLFNHIFRHYNFEFSSINFLNFFKKFWILLKNFFFKR